jgi:hypothetical protein
MEKIAYIIITHKDPAHLRKLISALDFYADFYIHIDKKVNSEPFRKELSSLQREIYVINKYTIEWGGYSQVLAQKELLRAVLYSGNKYKRIVCISGQDYPVYSNRRIHEVFDKNPHKEFIAGQNISHDEPKEIHRIINYYLVDYPFTVDSPMAIKILRKFSNIFKLNLRKRSVSYLNEKVADIFFGSDWWAITYNCAKYVYDSLCKEKKFLRYISTAYVPSELCINSIVFNSEFGNNAIIMPKNFSLSIPGDVAFERISPLHYLEYREKMNTLVKSDYDTILKSNKIFIRKAETGISDSLLDLIDISREE